MMEAKLTRDLWIRSGSPTGRKRRVSSIHLKPADHLNVECGSLVIWLRQCRQQGLVSVMAPGGARANWTLADTYSSFKDILYAAAEYLTYYRVHLDVRSTKTGATRIDISPRAPRQS
jgi:hypothetical protein